MCDFHEEEIENLRKNIESLSLPSNYNIEEDSKKKNNNKNNYNNKKIEFIMTKYNKRIIVDDDEEEEDEEENYVDSKINLNNNTNEIKVLEKIDEMPKKQKMKIEKNFDDIYDNIYQKDFKYFYEQRAKKFKEMSFDSFSYKAKYTPKKKKSKSDFNDIFEEIGNNNHKSKYEAANEDEFVSSDSYDADLVNLTAKVNKKYKLNTKLSLMENKENLNEIYKVLKICKERDNEN